MARQDALSIVDSNADEDLLAEAYEGLIERVQKGAVSEKIKNKRYSGDPTTGSVEVSRFKNATMKNYGTARGNGKGDALVNAPITIKVDTDKEIVEEVALKDLKLRGAGDIAMERKDDHAKEIVVTLDKAFFTEAVASGTEVETLTYGETIQEMVEDMIVSVETIEDDFTEGVDREDIVVCVKPEVYSKILNYIDSVPNSITGLTEKQFHNAKIYSNGRQSKDIIVMRDGAIAQLVMIGEYDLEKINLSEDFALSTFVHYGTKAVNPNLIKYADLPEAPTPSGNGGDANGSGNQI